MQRLFTLLLLLAGFYGTLSAQSSFTVSATEVWTITPHTTQDMEAHFDITNRTAQTQTIRWTRNVIEITSGCESQVCDLNICYTPVVSTKTFDIDPNFTGPIIMHFLNFDTLLGSEAIIDLNMAHAKDPADSVIVTFLYTSPLSNTGQPLPAADVKLFPNPTVDYFQLSNADAVSRIRVFAADSRVVARFTATPDRQYSLADQAPGVYYLALEDEHGRVFQAIRLVKN